MQLKELILSESINDKGLFKAVFFAGIPGAGKAQPLWERVLTPNGWVQMKDINNGDVVVTPAGDYATVTGVFPHQDKQIYKITFDDGGTVHACDEHLWEVYLVDNKDVTNKQKVVIDTMSVKDLVERNDYVNVCVKTVSPSLNYHTLNNAIDLSQFKSFYELGCMLGNGTLYNTFVPTITSMEAQSRLEMLRGLMDTCGSVTEEGEIIFSSVNFNLSSSVVDLIRSLGLIATTPQTHIPHELSKRMFHVVTLKDCHGLGVFKDEQKLALYVYDPQSDLRTIKSVEYYSTEPAQCIMIDHPDHLYVTSNFTVTHNTYVSTKITDGTIQPRIINTDSYLEYLGRAKGVNITDTEVQRSFLDTSKKVAKSVLVNAINGMLPVFIDGTSSNAPNIMRRKGILEGFGYDVAMIWIDTPLDEALARAEKRTRKVNTAVIEKIHERSSNNKDFYKSKFAEFVVVQNGQGELNDEAVLAAYRKASKFFNAPLSNPIGKRHLEELHQSKDKYLTPNIHKKDDLVRLVSGWYTSM
jgi:predicted kinase